MTLLVTFPICVVCGSIDITYIGASRIRTPLFRIVHLSWHMFENQSLFLNRKWLTNLEIQLSGQSVWERRCPDRWGSTVVVLPISIRWTAAMLLRVRSWTAPGASRVPCLTEWQWFVKFPQHITWQVDISPVLSGINNQPTIQQQQIMNLIQ